MCLAILLSADGEAGVHALHMWPGTAACDIPVCCRSAFPPRPTLLPCPWSLRSAELRSRSLLVKLLQEEIEEKASSVSLSSPPPCSEVTVVSGMFSR